MKEKIKNIFIEGPITGSFIGEKIASHQSKTAIGGHSIFLGQVRGDIIRDKTVAAIEYSSYSEMALSSMHNLREAGIGCNNYFPPIHLQPYMVEKYGYKAGDFPVCEYVSSRTLALPFFSRMTSNQVDRVCEVLERSLEKMLVAETKRFR